jgi:hypothetical protein
LVKSSPFITPEDFISITTSKFLIYDFKSIGKMKVCIAEKAVQYPGTTFIVPKGVLL